MASLCIRFVTASLLFGLAIAGNKLPIPNPPPFPVGPPMPLPSYMKDNQHNYFHSAPDKGTLNGPVLPKGNWHHPNRASPHRGSTNSTLKGRQSSPYWVEDIQHGIMPLAAEDYPFFRNVMDYGAVGDGVTDDTAAINAAASDGMRCGQECGQSSVLGALVYFPPGTYLLSSPIIQFYYTVFVGDANDFPTIKGAPNFAGIALIDSDVYIPSGNGAEWYINQNQFYRGIRNFNIDLTAMPSSNQQGDQTFVPTGIHWQVAQATSLQNINFNMPVSTAAGQTTAVGIFMENGSGGFMSDLTFFGGNVGFMAGSQQFTARNLQFTSCITAIKHIWNWSFTWSNIQVTSVFIAFDLTEFGGDTGQGTGSISVIDSTFDAVPFSIKVPAAGTGVQPNIFLDNLVITGNTGEVVIDTENNVLLEGTTSDQLVVGNWAMGNRYQSTSGQGSFVTGFVTPSPTRPSVLVDGSGNWFTRSKPLYENLSAGDFVIITEQGVSNDMSGDQSGAINAILSAHVGTPIFFPAGIYLVENTIDVPVGSIIVGEAWSQIMATGANFQNAESPLVMFRVGQPGDTGSVEISDLLFTVQGPTIGAILVEWNVAESSQGSAAMWDCHFRVGGALGSNLELAQCGKDPSGGILENCSAATILFHITEKATGYFENVWAWTADHDIDTSPNGANTTTGEQITIYSARGILIESQGPVWMYGTASEHNQMYQYNLVNAQNIFMGLIQTETPYYQPNPPAVGPYVPGAGNLFNGDPTFTDCVESDSITCMSAWALRIISSQNVFVYGAGLYSFFSNYDQSCLATESCQSQLIQTSCSSGIWMYNIATKGSIQAVSPAGGAPPTLQNNTQSGFTTEISVWTELGDTGSELCLGADGSSDGGIVFVDPIVWSEPSPTVQCNPPCSLVFPPKQLTTTTTISYDPVITFLTFSTAQSRSTVINGVTQVIPAFSFLTIPTTISIPPQTTTAIPVWGISIPAGVTSTNLCMTSSIQPSPITVTAVPVFGGTTSVVDGTTVTLSGFSTNVTTATFSVADVVEVIGGQTQIVGGSTAGPITTVITPQPYPSQSQTTCDPVLNTATTTFTAGPPGPTCTHDCGSLCFFCIPFCPVCAPGPPPFFPGPGGILGPIPVGDEPCEIETASSCVTLCPGGQCSSTCSNVLQCSATDSSTLFQALFGPFQEGFDGIVPEDANDDLMAATTMSSILESIYGVGNPTITGPGTQPTTPVETALVGIMLEENFLDSGFTEFEWQVFNLNNLAIPGGLCDATAIVSTGNTPQPFPTSLPTFNIGTFTNCAYSGSRTSPGSITCDGAVSAQCTTPPTPGGSNFADCGGGVSVTFTLECILNK